jgi:hypothetical protein
LCLPADPAYSFAEVSELAAALAAFTPGDLADVLGALVPRLPTHRRLPLATALVKLRGEPRAEVAALLAKVLAARPG